MHSSPAPGTRRRPFLTARWESLLLLNYPCRREWLEPLVPAGTELDAWHGETLVSLVGFLFTDTRLLGVPVPFHRTFEEVNLRFYVRRPGPDGVMRRAVVFISELVPRFDMSLAASWNPSYVTANGGTPTAAFAAFSSGLDTGRGYLNIHSSSFGGGEIRGFLLPAVPEPQTYALMLAGLAVVGWAARRGQRA